MSKRIPKKESAFARNWSIATIGEWVSNKKGFSIMTEDKPVSERKQGITTEQLLKTINVNISAYIKRLALMQPYDLSEQHSKKGPGRKHKQGECTYIPEECDNFPQWVHFHTPNRHRGI